MAEKSSKASFTKYWDSKKKESSLLRECIHASLHRYPPPAPILTHTKPNCPQSYNYRLCTFKVVLKGAITIKMASPVHSLNNAILSTYCTSKAMAWVMKEIK